MPKPTSSPASLQGEGRSSALSSFQMAYALLPRITTEIKTLSSSTSPPSTSFEQPPSDQPSHTLKLREDLEALQSMVRSIQSVLADAAEREIIDESVKLLLRELSFLVYDADDALDDFNYELLRAQVEAGIQSDGASRSPDRERKPHRVKSVELFSGDCIEAAAGVQETAKERTRLRH